MDATLATIKRFCAPRWGAPDAPPDAVMTPDPVMLQRVKNSIEAFVSDAAADEIRAGCMLAGQTVRGEVAKVLPCLRVVLRDKPHASRRLLSRLWKADPFLHQVHSLFVTEEKSPTKLIQYSEQFSAWFQKNISAIEPHLRAVAKPSNAVKDLRYAVVSCPWQEVRCTFRLSLPPWSKCKGHVRTPVRKLRLSPPS